MRYFTVAACLCDNPRRILLLRRFLAALLPLVLFAFFLFPGTTWAGAGSPDIFRTLRSTLHPAIIIAAFLYLGLRVIQPLHMSRPAKAALLLAAALLLGRVYMARAIFLLWHCEIIRPVYIAWSILQLALLLFIALHAVLTVLSSLYRRLRGCPASEGVRIRPGLSAALLALSLGLASFGCFSALRVPPVTPEEIVVPGLPAAWDGLTVAHLSDLHVGRTFPGTWLADVVAAVNAARPDLIVITGDLLDGSASHHLGELHPLHDLKAPLGVYACPGNHEYYSVPRHWPTIFSSLGVEILENEHVILRRNGAELILAGITDDLAEQTDLPRPDIRQALQGTSPALPLLLLSHRPAHVRELRALDRPGATLQLSGHTHGGQLLGLNLLVKYLNKGYLSGPYALDAVRLYVSPGTALSASHPFRLGAAASRIPLLILRAPRD